MSDQALGQLKALLAAAGDVAIAVSGGVDSLTLATVAGDVLGRRAHMLHAVSPAVPDEATRRTEAMAAAKGWQLEVLDAGEFADPSYRANPVNRCFFCKINLYGAIAARTRQPIMSGTNLDDLGEYRPGLEAAREHAVRHPFVEVGITKAMVRAIARDLDLPEIAALPAAPCLSSRVESGIRIEAPLLRAVHAAERLIAADLSPRTVRCRVRREGVVIELDEASLGLLDQTRADALRRALEDVLAPVGPSSSITFAPYRTGSAFLTASP